MTSITIKMVLLAYLYTKMPIYFTDKLVLYYINPSSFCNFGKYGMKTQLSGLLAHPVYICMYSHSTQCLSQAVWLGLVIRGWYGVKSVYAPFAFLCVWANKTMPVFPVLILSFSKAERQTSKRVKGHLHLAGACLAPFFNSVGPFLFCTICRPLTAIRV